MKARINSLVALVLGVERRYISYKNKLQKGICTAVQKSNNTNNGNQRKENSICT
jgi:hypothetical protein